MTRLAEIQEAIHRLPPAELAELRQWLLEEETAELLATVREGAQRIEAVATGQAKGLTEDEFRRALR